MVVLSVICNPVINEKRNSYDKYDTMGPWPDG